MKNYKQGWSNDRRLLLIVLIVSYIALSIWAMHQERRNELRYISDPEREELRQLEEMEDYHGDNSIIFK